MAVWVHRPARAARCYDWAVTRWVAGLLLSLGACASSNGSEESVGGSLYPGQKRMLLAAADALGHSGEFDAAKWVRAKLSDGTIRREANHLRNGRRTVVNPTGGWHATLIVTRGERLHINPYLLRPDGPAFEYLLSILVRAHYHVQHAGATIDEGWRVQRLFAESRGKLTEQYLRFLRDPAKQPDFGLSHS